MTEIKSLDELGTKLGKFKSDVECELKSKLSNLDKFVNENNVDAISAFIQHEAPQVCDEVYILLSNSCTNYPLLRLYFGILSQCALHDYIQCRLLQPSIDLYIACNNESLQNDIMLFLTNVFYDDRPQYRNELVACGFYNCIPIYMVNLNKVIQAYINNNDRVMKIVSHERKVAFDLMDLYIAQNQYTNSTAPTYHAIFSVCSNLAFKDIIARKMVDNGTLLFKQYESADLKYEILYFLGNVVHDKKKGHFLYNYEFYALDYLKKYRTYNSTFSAEIYTTLDNHHLDDDHEFIDISLTILSDNLDTPPTTPHTFDKINNSIYAFYKSLDNPDDADYICRHPTTLRLIQDAIKTRINLEYITKLMTNFTANELTEYPCEVYYKSIFTPLLTITTNPEPILLALSNIFSKSMNFSFVNLDDVTRYLTRIMTGYRRFSPFCVDMYHIIQNLRVTNNLVHVLTPEFVYAYMRCIDSVGSGQLLYSTLVHVIRTMSQYEHLHHYFDEPFGRYALGSDQDQDKIEQYMNCTLQQQCALVLHRNNQLNVKDLEDLDIHLYLGA